MTILGDKAQTMEEKTRDVLSFLPRVFGRGIRKINMNKSYRNTMEIASYANSISDVSDMELFERHGKPVDFQTERRHWKPFLRNCVWKSLRRPL